MPDTSTILSLPYILPAQAQKHVTHNEALRQLDVIVQLAVTARNLATPPASPVLGDRYIVAAGSTGAWAGKAGQIALYEGGAWQFFAPVTGWTAWIAAESALASYNGSLWVTLADGPQRFGQIGVSADATATNRLSVSSPATLLNHVGAGHQVKVNKAAISDTASLMFQTAFSGRAEMGTAGNDDFAIKVSADGSAFVTGLSIAGASGQVTLPAALRLGGQATDPVSPSNGMIWLNSTTGEIKVRSNGVSIVIAAVNGIANAQLAQMAAATFKGRDTGAGVPQDLTATQAAAILPIVTSTARGLAPASGGGSANFLRADGTWAAPPGSSLAALGITTTAAQINAVSATIPQNVILGRKSSGTGVVEPLTPAEARVAMGVQGAGNLLINGTGRINQRGYVSGAATTAANQFTLDRWFVVTSGQNLTFTGSVAGYTMTAPAGGVSQVIEGANITGGTYCLSWVGSATATVNGAAVANGGTVTLTAGANATVRFSGGTFTQAQLELGTVPTPFQRLDISEELRVCQRFFATVTASAQSPAVGVLLSPFYLPVTMRATPTLTVTAAGTIANASVNDTMLNAGMGHLQLTASAANGFCVLRTYSISAELTA